MDQHYEAGWLGARSPLPNTMLNTQRLGCGKWSLLTTCFTSLLKQKQTRILWKHFTGTHLSLRCCSRSQEGWVIAEPGALIFNQALWSPWRKAGLYFNCAGTF